MDWMLNAKKLLLTYLHSKVVITNLFYYGDIFYLFRIFWLADPRGFEHCLHNTSMAIGN